MLIPDVKKTRGQTNGNRSKRKREGLKMKTLKMLFVLICLLAYMWVFSLPAQGQDFKPLFAPHPQNIAADTTLPIQALVERNSPLYADRQMTEKIKDVPAGHQVMVLRKYGTGNGDRPLILLVAYTDNQGKDHMGWFYGTMHVRLPH